MYYFNVTHNPNTSVTRTARFTVTDVNSNSGSATQNITVTSVNSVPVIAINDATSLTYHANGTAIAIASDMGTVTDPDSNNLTSLTIPDLVGLSEQRQRT